MKTARTAFSTSQLRLSPSWLALPLALALGVASLCAQQAGPSASIRSVPATLITGGIEVDGVLDEPLWRDSPKIGELVQRIPNSGAQASERTEVTILYDKANLYIGVMCYDSEPNKVLAAQMTRDSTMNTDDRVELLLDTFHDRTNAFYFATNPNGAFVDGLIFANGETNNDWDAIWNVRARRHDKGWSAEFAIPFKSLNFPPDGAVWGFNIARHIQRKLEEARWTAVSFQTRFQQVSEAGEITGLQNLEQGLSLDVRPFVAQRYIHREPGGEDTILGKGGLDLFYNITPNLRLTSTFNTDFGETEVDDRQINLTRFSIFFPEKRTFFLQDAGVFNFATTGITQPGGVPPNGAAIFPFFSRRIGIIDGQEVPIDYGVKLTGKVGRTEVGILNVNTRDNALAGGANLFAARVRQNFWQQSYIGAIVTGGNPGERLDSSMIGADMRLATAHFLGGDQNFLVNAWGLKSNNQGVHGKDAAYGFGAAFPNDRYQAQVEWREIQENFDPALGFVQRSNVRMWSAGFSFNPRPKEQKLGVQQMFHDFFYRRFTRIDNGQVETWNINATIFDWHFQSGDSVHSIMDLNPTYERLFEPFEISPGVVLPPGEYRFTPFRFSFASAQKRKLQGNFGLTVGNFWSGTAKTVTTGLRYQLPPRFAISLTTNQTFASLPQGNFVARILSSTIDFALSPLLTFRNLVQFDNRSGNLGLQSRVRWTIAPGNDLFFVFGQGWVQELDERGGLDFRVRDVRLATKLQYTFRF